MKLLFENICSFYTANPTKELTNFLVIKFEYETLLIYKFAIKHVRKAFQ